MNLQYISDDNGKKLSVVLPIKDYQKLISKLEKLESEIVPQWHKDIVLERIKTAKKEDYISWDTAKQRLSK